MFILLLFQLQLIMKILMEIYVLISNSIGTVLSKDNIVIYESTVYPGCTEEDCIPILEKIIRLKV